MSTHSEFTVQDLPRYNHKSAIRWILSHLWHHGLFVAGTLGFSLVSYILFSQGQVMIGEAAAVILDPTAEGALVSITLGILAVFVISGAADLIRSLSLEVLAQRLEYSARR